MILTQDLDFANIMMFPPQDYAGIVVLRLHDQSRPSVLAVMSQLVSQFNSETVTGCLWIVDESGIRIRPGVTP